MKLYQIRLVVGSIAVLSLVLSGVMLQYRGRGLLEELVKMESGEWEQLETMTPEVQYNRLRRINHDVILPRIQNRYPQMPDYMAEQLLDAYIELKNPGEKTVEGSEAYVAMRRFLDASMEEHEATTYLERLEYLAGSGDAESARLLGFLTSLGAANDGDPQIAFQCYLAAAEAGDAEAAREVAFCLEQGVGVASDLDKAVEWYTAAAQMGHVDALVDLGFLYETLALGDPDYALAHMLYQEAIDQGSSRGRVYLAMDYLSGWDNQEADMDRTLELLNSAAEMRDAQAHRMLAMIYGRKDFGPYDRDLKMAHTMIAANLDDPYARYMFGKSLLRADSSLVYDKGWNMLSDLTLEGNTGSANVLASELMETDAEERLEDSMALLEWSANEGSREAIGKLIEYSFDPDIPIDQRPDFEHWLSELNAIDPLQAELTRLYIGQGMSPRESFLLVNSMEIEEQYMEKLRLSQEQREREIADSSIIVDKPIPIQVVSPEFPHSMLLLDMEGEVECKFVVRSDGRVTDVTVIDSPHDEFSRATVDALQQWQFKPATSTSGEPVSTWVRISFPFFVSK